MESLLNTLHIIFIIFIVLMVFNLMIVVHEWGHFLAARWRGLKIEKFYVWFGKPLWKKTINGVEYGLGSIPMGGFVALPQMAPMEAIEGRADESREVLPPITPLDKIIVAIAGPLFSFLLAVLFAFLVFWTGKPVYETERTTTIGFVKKGLPADRAGLKPGDEIISIDGKTVRTFYGQTDSVPWGVISSEGKTIDFEIKRGDTGKIEHVPVDGEVISEESQTKPNWLEKLFMRPGLRKVGVGPVQTMVVDSFMNDQEHNPAKTAGLKKGDILRKVNGQPMLTLSDLADILKAQPDKPLTLELERDTAPVTVTVTPRPPDQRPPDWKLTDYPLAPLGVNWDERGRRILDHPSPWTQVKEAARTIYDTLKLITGGKSEVGPGQLSGAIGIGRVYYSLLQDPEGPRRVLWFSVVLNVNLAMLNMLPFPVLDGGHIMMALYEWIRRKPIHIRLLEVVQTACVLLLLTFMVFVSLKDIGDIFGIGRKNEAVPKEQVEQKFLAPGQAPEAK